ncbi:MAG: hypothetical protein Fur0024_3590 [Patescibacteria group bacterium]
MLNFEKIEKLFSELIEIEEILKTDFNIEWQKERERIASELEEKISFEESKLKFSGTYDKMNCTLEIHAGTGGTEAMDWASMLLRMYLRFCEKNNFDAKIIDKLDGEDAGIKTATIEIFGEFAFGNLRSESGTHRLVRISPFNAQGLRQTSFALVIVTPIFPESESIEIKKEDIEIQSYHSSGKGGQSVNTTNSAVRIVHKASGIVVTCQTERSFEQNKMRAINLLKSKLEFLRAEEEANKTNKARGEVKTGSWGNQIRNYVLQPYQLVKDTRTGIESKDPDGVLDGDLRIFIDGFLEMRNYV